MSVAIESHNDTVVTCDGCKRRVHMLGCPLQARALDWTVDGPATPVACQGPPPRRSATTAAVPTCVRRARRRRELMGSGEPFIILKGRDGAELRPADQEAIKTAIGPIMAEFEAMSMRESAVFQLVELLESGARYEAQGDSGRHQELLGLALSALVFLGVPGDEVTAACDFHVRMNVAAWRAG
jgi:hypothetical protein